MDRNSSALRAFSRPRFASLAVIPIAFLAVFFVYPIGTILWRGLTVDHQSLLALSGNSNYLHIGWFTLWQATASTAITLIVALPATHLLARKRFTGRRLLRATTTVPFVLPTVVVGSCFVAAFDRLHLEEGAFRLHHTIWAVLIAHAFFNIAVVIRTVGVAWEGLDPHIEEQAQVLGATPLRAFFTVTVPRLAPAMASASAIVFLFCLTSFGVILILGGPTMATLETEIWRHAVWRGDIGTATALGIIQILAVAATVATANRLQRRQSRVGRLATRSLLPKPGFKLLAGNLSGLAVLVALPVGILVERSFRTGDGYSLRNYQALTEQVDLLPVTSIVALRNSLIFALIAMGLATVVGGLASVVIVGGRNPITRLLDLGLTLPLGASAVTLGFGMLIAFDTPPLDLRSSRWLIPVVHSLIGIPFVIRIVVPTLRSIEKGLHEAAATLGASPTIIRRKVDYPIASRSLLVGAGFAFAISIGEFGATAFLPRSPERLTAPLALFRLLGTPGEVLQGQAMALAVVLMGVTTVAVFMIEGIGTSGQEAL